jgi:hypothetical protein
MPESGTKTPIRLKIKVEKYTEAVINETIEYTFYINGQEFKELPLDANVREPETETSAPYNDMCFTLKHNPKDFFENNLGISVIAEQVTKLNAHEFELVFPSGAGILNGGHTQQAILDTQKTTLISDAIVKVNVREKKYTLDRIAEIASTQNSSTPVKPYTLAEKKGYFTKLKRYFQPNNEKHIKWYQGRKLPNKKGLEATDLIAIMNVFNINLYLSDYSSSKIQPNISATSKAAAFKRWENDPTTFECIYPLVNDIIELYEFIIEDYAEGTGMTKLKIIQDKENKSKTPLIFSGRINEYNIPKQFLMPLLASFRANVYYDNAKNQVGWYEDNKHLFKKLKKELSKRIISTYRTTYHNDINNASKDPNLWELLYVQVNSQISKSRGATKKYDI